MDIDAVVVGAGHAGLATSFHLGRLGIEHVVLEAGRIGESWRSQRWESFVLNTPTSFNRMPGDGPEADPGPADGFVAGLAWADHLERYARDHRLPVRTDAPVTDVSAGPPAGPGHPTFRLTVDGTEQGVIRTRALVVASGWQRVPGLPAIAGGVPAGIESLHAAAYRRPDLLRPGGVLVVGCAQSGGQIAEDLLGAGRRVIVATGPVPRVPRRYRGRDIFARLGDIGFWDMTLADLPDARMARATQPIISGVGRFGHTISLQGLAGRGAELTGRLVAFDGDRARFAPDLADSIRFGDQASSAMRARLDAWIAVHDPEAPPADADLDPDDRPVEDPDAFRAPDALDLRTERIGSIIWATGFGPDVAWAGGLLRGPDGTPRQAGGRGETPGTWTLGVPWMRSRGSALVLGADRDGAFVAGEVAAALRA